MYSRAILSDKALVNIYKANEVYFETKLSIEKIQGPKLKGVISLIACEKILGKVFSLGCIQKSNPFHRLA